MDAIVHRRRPWSPGAAVATAVVVVAFLLLAVFAAPASAAEAAGAAEDSQVVLSGHVDVASGETSDDIVVLHGAVIVDGVVDGSVVVFDGPVTVNGEVTDDLVAFNGAVAVSAEGRVGGDVVSPRGPSIASGASIGGEVLRTRADWGLNSIAITRFASWIAVSASTLVLGVLLGLFAPRAADAAMTVARTQPGRAAAWGLAVAIGLPLLAVLAIITVIGIPFGIGLLLALALLYSVGYVTLAWLVGRVVRPHPASQVWAFVLGWLIVRALALVPFLEGALWFPGAALGLGVLCAAAWTTGRPSSVQIAPVAGTPA